MTEEQHIREQICEVGRWLYARGLVAAFDGNISYRLHDDLVICTPTQTCKGRMRPDDLCIVDLDGDQFRGDLLRTSEIRLHLEIYRASPDARAVVHSHAPHALAYAVTGSPIPTGILAEVEVFLGDVPTLPYETPGTTDFAALVWPVALESRVALLANHGVVSWDETLERAYWWTEMLDAYCHVLLLAEQLGSPAQLPDDKLDELRAIRDSYR